MKKIILLFLVAIINYSCDKTPEEVSKFINEYDSIRLVSYNHHRIENLKIDGEKLIIPNTEFIDNVILNTRYSNKIFTVLLSPPDEGSLADCYDPRHIFLFYKNNKIIGYYEICTACGGSEQSGNIKLPDMVKEQGDELVKIFKDLKLKNDGEDNGHMKYF